MARKPMVTRTLTATHALVMCLDITAGESCTREVTVPRTYKDDTLLLKKVKPMLETDTLKAVHIVGKEEIQTLYGMPEEKFMELADVLPPREVEHEEDTNTETY